MRRSNPSLASIALAVSAAVCCMSTAQADVTTQEHMSVSGSGLMSMANMSGTTTTTISGSRARTESNLQFESGMMRALSRGAGQSTEIVQLDTDKIIELNVKKKTYTQSTFTERREQMQKSMADMQKGQAAQQQSASGVDAEQCEWSEPKANVIRNGEKATIGGFPAERVVITATQSCTDKKTGQVCDFGLTLDQWFARRLRSLRRDPGVSACVCRETWAHRGLVSRFRRARAGHVRPLRRHLEKSGLENGRSEGLSREIRLCARRRWRAMPGRTAGPVEQPVRGSRARTGRSIGRRAGRHVRQEKAGGRSAPSFCYATDGGPRWIDSAHDSEHRTGLGEPRQRQPAGLRGTGRLQARQVAVPKVDTLNLLSMMHAPSADRLDHWEAVMLAPHNLNLKNQHAC